jgi:hypothetical protein
VKPGILALFGEKTKQLEFTKECWVDYYTPKTPLEYRERLTFYRTEEDEMIPAGELSEVYSELSASPFVSLYSYLSWAEDLAEYCAMYHLTQNLGLSYEISLVTDGEAIFEYRPFDSPSLLRRASHLEFLKH